MTALFASMSWYIYVFILNSYTGEINNKTKLSDLASADRVVRRS